jgi:hypothetical protein
MQKLNLTLALAAGLLGGFLSRNLSLPTAQAQSGTPATREIRAQRFTLVDGKDRTVGTFMVDEKPTQRYSRIVLLDFNGRQIWSAGATAILP